MLGFLFLTERIKPKPILLVCNTRTGSTALGNALAASNEGVIFMGEAFHPGAAEQPEAFFYWLKDKNTSAFDFINYKFMVCMEYIQHVIEKIKGRTIIFDLKYHDISNLMPSPALLDFPPTIFDVVRELGGGILHLTRRNKFDSAMSQVVAQKRGIHHLLVGEKLTSHQNHIEADAGDVLYQVKFRTLFEKIVRKQIENSRCHYVEVAYEDIFKDDNSAALLSLQTLTGFPVTIGNMMHQKIGTNYAEIVSGYGDLRSAAEAWNSDGWPISEL